MSPPDPSQVALLSFDCYGTLIDWEAGIVTDLTPLLASHGVSPDPNALLGRYALREPEIQQDGEFLPYREVLSRVALAVAADFGVTLSPEDGGAFARSLPRWPPFPDTVKALTRLHTRFPLAVLSNVDDDLFEATRALLGVPFDHVVTAGQIRSYKPAPGHFQELLTRTGLSPGRILHVAQSRYHDIRPARELGFPTVWVNRRQGHARAPEGSGAARPVAVLPDWEVPDLTTLAALLVPGC